jgi:sugar/nucleoside kinase (ribokinase family)
MTARFDVVGVGANSVDFVYRLPQHPESQGAGAKLRINQHWVSCGGQTATALATCRSFGLSACYIGAIGVDDNGRRMREELARRGVTIDPGVTDAGTNQFAVILLDQRNGERIVLWDREDRPSSSSMPLPRDVIAATRLLHVDDVDQEAAIRAALIAREAGVPVTSDIDRLTDRTDELIQAVTIPIVAEHVLPAITGESDPERGLRKLRARHDGTLCVTLGAHGAAMLDGDRFIYVPGIEVDAVDTTGSGDVFRGGFIYATLNDSTPDQALRFANAAAAASCTRRGAIDSVPALEDVRALLGNQRLR